MESMRRETIVLREFCSIRDKRDSIQRIEERGKEKLFDRLFYREV